MRFRIGRRSPDQPAAGATEPDRAKTATGRARASMVAEQLERRGIRDARVLEAMASIPREAFVQGVSAELAYADRALPIEAGQTISQPYMVARMTELLEIEPGDRILEVGTGSGYQAAVLVWLGARVTSIERHAELAEAARRRLGAIAPGADAGSPGADGGGAGADGGGAVEVRVGDGSRGDPEGAPWNGIIVTAAAPSIPDALRDQLAVGARLVIPVGPHDRQELIVVERRTPTDWTEWSDGPVVFVPLVGEAGWEA